mmetsp:Transcript_3977/g.13144  ORF Transcript_3977/g.13144 Transcript_3977/m.13144 type:complete len:329 (+) Transcript_3977:1333-2319(+)
MTPTSSYSSETGCGAVWAYVPPMCATCLPRHLSLSPRRSGLASFSWASTSSTRSGPIWTASVPPSCTWLAASPSTLSSTPALCRPTCSSTRTSCPTTGTTRRLRSTSRSSAARAPCRAGPTGSLAVTPSSAPGYALTASMWTSRWARPWMRPASTRHRWARATTATRNSSTSVHTRPKAGGRHLGTRRRPNAGSRSCESTSPTATRSTAGRVTARETVPAAGRERTELASRPERTGRARSRRGSLMVIMGGGASSSKATCSSPTSSSTMNSSHMNSSPTSSRATSSSPMRSSFLNSKASSSRATSNLVRHRRFQHNRALTSKAMSSPA